MLNKSLPFYDILMKRPAGTPLPKSHSPHGITLRTYRNGDEYHWAAIETAAGEFPNEQKALSRFAHDFGPWKADLSERCFFALNADGVPVGNIAVWWPHPEIRKYPWIHWVAVRPEYQNLGIGTFLVARGINHAVQLEGDVDIGLKTQTWSWPAVKIYLRAGFRLTEEPGYGGFANSGFSEARHVLKDLVPDL
jgi:GNAT superfamily N-acetyltransferase